MKNFRPNPLPIFCMLFLSVCMFSSCFIATAIFKNSIKEDGKQIPAGFSKQNVTILALKHKKRSYDRYLERNFKSCYFGKYVFVTADSMDIKYPDVNEYRYYFGENVTYSEGTNSQGRPIQLAAASFYLHDRKTGVNYETKVNSGFWSKLMKIYLRKLEQARTGD